jgi:hypothetical protein
MILLQSKDEFNLLAFIEHESPGFRFVSKEHYGHVSTKGFFALLSGVFVALYVFDGIVFVRLGDSVLSAERTKILWERRGGEVCLSGVSDVFCFSISYTVEHVDYSMDLTAFTDAESFDFGLFIFSVINDKERLGRFKNAHV